MLVGSQGVSQLQESCSGKRNSRDAERRKCEVRPLKDILSKKKKRYFISKGGKQRWRVCIFDEVEQSGCFLLSKTFTHTPLPYPLIPSFPANPQGRLGTRPGL